MPTLDFYPGSDQVDLTGADVYDVKLLMGGNLTGLVYQDLVSVGKPFGLSEYGQGSAQSQGHGWDSRTVVRRIRASYPAAVYAIDWYSDPTHLFSLSDTAHTAELLEDPILRVIPFR
jgi:beta-mannanase